MKVDSASSTSSTQLAQSAGLGGGLGKDAFLKILLAQMRNQDPLNPTDGTAMVAQLAQFSTLEQMQNLNEKIDQLLHVQLLGELSGLVGKDVAFVDENDELQQGKAQSLVWNGTKSLLRINGVLVPLNRVLEVKDGDKNA